MSWPVDSWDFLDVFPPSLTGAAAAFDETFSGAAGAFAGTGFAAAFAGAVFGCFAGATFGCGFAATFTGFFAGALEGALEGVFPGRLGEDLGAAFDTAFGAAFRAAFGATLAAFDAGFPLDFPGDLAVVFLAMGAAFAGAFFAAGFAGARLGAGFETGLVVFFTLEDTGLADFTGFLSPFVTPDFTTLLADALEGFAFITAFAVFFAGDALAALAFGLGEAFAFTEGFFADVFTARFGAFFFADGMGLGGYWVGSPRICPMAAPQDATKMRAS